MVPHLERVHHAEEVTVLEVARAAAGGRAGAHPAQRGVRSGAEWAEREGGVAERRRRRCAAAPGAAVPQGMRPARAHVQQISATPVRCESSFSSFRSPTAWARKAPFTCSARAQARPRARRTLSPCERFRTKASSRAARGAARDARDNAHLQEEQLVPETRGFPVVLRRKGGRTMSFLNSVHAPVAGGTHACFCVRCESPLCGEVVWLRAGSRRAGRAAVSDELVRMAKKTQTHRKNIGGGCAPVAWDLLSSEQELRHGSFASDGDICVSWYRTSNESPPLRDERAQEKQNRIRICDSSPCRRPHISPVEQPWEAALTAPKRTTSSLSSWGEMKKLFFLPHRNCGSMLSETVIFCDFCVTLMRL